MSTDSTIRQYVVGFGKVADGLHQGPLASACISPCLQLHLIGEQANLRLPVENVVPYLL
jgi:hypothetical protein